MDYYFDEPRANSTDRVRRTLAAERSQRSYNNNKIKVARRRILNAIAKGRCVLRKTMHDPKYGWTAPERAMLQRCLDLRRSRYAIAPERITSIRDKRYQAQAKEVDLLTAMKRKLESMTDRNNGTDDVMRWVQSEIDRRDVVADGTPPPGPSGVRVRSPFPSPPSPPPSSSPGRQRPIQNTSTNANRRNHVAVVIRTPPGRTPPGRTPPGSRSRSASSTRGSPDLAANDDVVASRTDITVEDVIEAYEFMIDRNIIYEHRSRNVKNNGKQEYRRAAERFFETLGAHAFPTANLMDVYTRPKRYRNVTKSNKKWLQILYKLHNTSCRDLFRRNRVAQGIVDLCYNVENIRDVMEQFSVLQKRDKEAEENRQKNAPFFDWNDIRRIPELIRGNTIQANRDRIIMRFYIHENIVRDNLGHIRILTARELREARARPNGVDYNYVYRDDTRGGRYVIKLNDFKNVRQRGSLRIEVSDETSRLIDTYLEQMRTKVGPSADVRYLITKNDGEPYREGKLSRYIIDMFKRYTGMKHLGINELRHSVATYYKDQSEAFKARLAYKMQHSLPQHIKYERYSNKVIRIPVFHPNDPSLATSMEDPFVNKPIKILLGRVIHIGMVHKMPDGESDKEYKVIFEDAAVAPRYYTSTDIAVRLENDDVVMNIGKRVRYTIPNDEEPVFGREGHVDGEIGMNETFFYDTDAPPYKLVTNDDNPIVEKTFHLPHPNISML